MRTIDEILADQEAVIGAAEGRNLTDEEVARFEDLETELTATRRSSELRARQAAYRTPVGAGAGLQVITPESTEDTLERAFEAYLRTGQANHDIAELRAQEVGTPSEGGYLVPDGFRMKLVEARKAFGGLSNEVDNFTTSTGNPLEYPTLDDTANVGGITPEEDAFVDGADLTFGTVTLGAYKYTATGAGTTTPLRVSVELLQDSAFDVQALVSRALGTRIARKQASDWVVGSGSGMPQGIAGATITEDLAVDVHDVVDYDDLLEAESLLDPAYEQNAKWLMSKATWTKIRAIVDGDDRPLIQANATAGIGGGVDKQLLGYPVVIDQAMPNFPGAGNEKFLILGDLREAYAIRRVSNLVVVVNPWTRANFGQVEFTAYERADGVVQNRAAYILMDNTAS